MAVREYGARRTTLHEDVVERMPVRHTPRAVTQGVVRRADTLPPGARGRRRDLLALVVVLGRRTLMAALVTVLRIGLQVDTLPTAAGGLGRGIARPWTASARTTGGGLAAVSGTVDLPALADAVSHLADHVSATGGAADTAVGWVGLFVDAHAGAAISIGRRSTRRGAASAAAGDARRRTDAGPTHTILPTRAGDTAVAAIEPIVANIETAPRGSAATFHAGGGGTGRDGDGHAVCGRPRPPHPEQPRARSAAAQPAAPAHDAACQRQRAHE